MKARIYSQLVDHFGGQRLIKQATLAFVGCTLTSIVISSPIQAQDNNGFFTDPATGIVYRKVAKTVERPVIETKVESRNQTIYRPQTVTETKPEARTVYQPVVEYKWEPRLHGRWNPFARPTVAYHHVPETRWEARNEVVNRTDSRTEWVAENRTVEVPQQIVRMEREQKVEFEPVGKVAPAQQASPGIDSAVAARLRPLDSTARVEPIGGTQYAVGPAYTAPSFSAPRIAATSVGRMTSDPPRRNEGQSGVRATELYPSSSTVRGQALPPASGGVGIANLPSLPFMR
ncbi:hypothetical protein N9N28_01145 [Rubripirellula amarantea]|nr:hypothetical protein [Rubripirellula amarantea]